MDVNLNALKREDTGKGAARRLRQTDRVPACLYGPKTEPINLSVGAKELEMLLRGIGEESRLLNLTIGEGSDEFTKQVLVRELQVHPVRRRFLHIDFYEVPLDRQITVDVPVETYGDSIGAKKGGTVNLVRRMLSIRCLPGEIPERIRVDIAELDLGEVIRIDDLVGKLPFDFTEDGHVTVVNVSAPEGAAEEGGE